MGITEYPVHNRIEKAWTPTQTPKPVVDTQKPTTTSKPKPTSKPIDVCWSIAKRYFNNLKWKNPKSVTINEYSYTYDFPRKQYTFTIDYSAENGFGGMNRGYYWITVDADTGEVVTAFGNN